LSGQRQWRASFIASRQSGFTIGFMARAPRLAETSSSISKALQFPSPAFGPVTSAQLSLSAWRPNPVHFVWGKINHRARRTAGLSAAL
jgi:hypothetical protein